MITLAVDCMGGDHGPRVTLAACRQFLGNHPDARLLLVGLADSLKDFSHDRATIVPATEVVAMDDPVEVALRRKKDSSMRVAIQQVKDGQAQAAVSAGNTGALMALARYLLKTLDGIDRPAIATQLPNNQGRATTVLDLGANVDCSAEHLLQFAVMGSALVSALRSSSPLRLMMSLPLMASSPMLSRPTETLEFSSSAETSAVPMKANCSRCSAVQSTLAPRSSTVVAPPLLLGNCGAMAGRSMPSSVLSR